MFNKLFLIIFISLFFIFSSINLFASSQVTLDFFWSNGCPHCAKEKVFLEELKLKYPNLIVNSYEISQNMANALLFQSVGQKLGADISGVPFTVVGDKYVVGFGSNDTTGREIESFILSAMKETNPTQAPITTPNIVLNKPEIKEASEETLPIPLNSEIPKDSPKELLKDTNVHIPLLGTVYASKVSLPILTFLIALVDGFNPCAMWTLLFLISLLLGMKDRKRMWALGIAFIATSALVYFLFLSAWLNLFLFLGFISWIRILIALVALGAGFIYLKKYHQNRTGCEVVGEEKRHKVFDKLKIITSKKSFFLAITGIILLAIAVNMVELICSAGLPAIYTKVLSMYQLPTWHYYSYLFFYILVFMLDDLFIFFTAMFTLQVTGIQSKYTHASHLIGGVLMLSIGLLLLFKPEILMFG